jgi:glycosyltransferase involved in cell wall biosynthesis
MPEVSVLFVFKFLAVGGEETELRLLGKHLDRARYAIDVVECLRKPDMPEQTHRRLESLGLHVDRTPQGLSADEIIEYLANKVSRYDVVVACQAVPHIFPALERAARRPPLIEHGGVVEEVRATPKHLTTRYVGVCAAIRDAAAACMADRPRHARRIPSMVDLSEFDCNERATVRAEWGVLAGVPVIGSVGRLDRRKRAEDFLRAAAVVRRTHPRARFLVIGGPSVFTPEYDAELRALAGDLELDGVLSFLGDRSDVPRLLGGLDALVLLARGEGMPHVIAEAGAACLPAVATPDNGTEEQIVDGVTGLFVPHEDPAAVAAAIERLIDDPNLRRRLGRNLRRKVEREYSAAVLTRQWEALFDEVIAEHTW